MCNPKKELNSGVWPYQTYFKTGQWTAWVGSAPVWPRPRQMVRLRGRGHRKKENEKVHFVVNPFFDEISKAKAAGWVCYEPFLSRACHDLWHVVCFQMGWIHKSVSGSLVTRNTNV